MAVRPALIAAGIAGTLALGTATNFAIEWRVCRELETEYLEEATALGTGLQSGEAMPGLVDEKPIADRIATSMQNANRIYFRMRSRCGDERALAVQQKGLDLIQSIRRKPT